MRASFVSASVTQRVLLQDELQLFLGSWVKSLISEAKSLYTESCEGRRQGATPCYFGREGLRSERSRLLKRAASRSLLSRTEASGLPTSVWWPWVPHPPSESSSLFCTIVFFVVVFLQAIKNRSPDWTSVLWISIQPLETRSPGSKSQAHSDFCWVAHIDE